MLVPLCDSLFDRDSAAGCIEELRAHPRVASGRVQVGVVGMRLDWALQGEPALREWADRQGLALVGAVRDSRAYVAAAERGLTVFDLPIEQTRADRAEWRSIFDWIDGAMARIPTPTVSRPLRAGQAGAAAAARVEAADAAAPMRAATALPAPAPLRVAPAAGTEAVAQVPITLIHPPTRAEQVPEGLRHWLSRMRPAPSRRRDPRIRTGP